MHTLCPFQQSVIHIIFQIQINLPLVRVVGNVFAAVQALCRDCDMDGRRQLTIAGDGEDGGFFFKSCFGENW